MSLISSHRTSRQFPIAIFPKRSLPWSVIYLSDSRLCAQMDTCSAIACFNILPLCSTIRLKTTAIDLKSAKQWNKVEGQPFESVKQLDKSFSMLRSAFQILVHHRVSCGSPFLPNELI